MSDAAFMLEHLGYNSLTELFEQLYLAAVLKSSGNLKGKVNFGPLKENEIRDLLVRDLEFENTLLERFLERKVIDLKSEVTRLRPDTEKKVRTDIEFFISGVGSFVIECKKLDGYTNLYLDEGVHRFRDGKYSIRDSEASMLAFVVDGDVSRIVKKTKANVEMDPSYFEENSHSLICAGYPHSFHSIHRRFSADPILIHHIFLDFR